MRTLQTILLLGICSMAATACSSETEGKELDPNGASSGDDTDDIDDDGPDGDDVDDDGDGFTEVQGDCDDQNAEVYPGAAEYCNNLDDDCDGEIDDPSSLADGQGSTAWADDDGDGFGYGPTVLACEFSEGYADNDLDCDDTEATANPDGTEENFNGIDEDCDGQDYLLEACIEEAMAMTAVQMENGGDGIALADFVEEYDLVVNVPVIGTTTFEDAGFGRVENQLALIRDGGYLINESGNDYVVSFETTLAYNDNADKFLLTVGVEESWWIYNIPLTSWTIGDVLTTLMEPLPGELPDNWDGTFSCYGYVDATPTDFDGTMELAINESRGTVTATVALESNVTQFTDGDATLSSLEGGQCSNDIITAITGYFGIGDTYEFLNENLVLVGKQLVFTYETTLAENIDAACSKQD